MVALALTATLLRADPAYDFANRFGQMASRSENHNEIYSAALCQAMNDHGFKASMVSFQWGFEYGRQGQYWGTFVAFQDAQGHYWAKGSTDVHPRQLPAQSAQWANYYCGAEIWVKEQAITPAPETSRPVVAAAMP